VSIEKWCRQATNLVYKEGGSGGQDAKDSAQKGLFTEKDSNIRRKALGDRAKGLDRQGRATYGNDD